MMKILKEHWISAAAAVLLLSCNRTGLFDFDKSVSDAINVGPSTPSASDVAPPVVDAGIDNDGGTSDSDEVPTLSGDPYEPDDEWTQASPIVPGETQSHTIEGEEGEVDWISFAISNETNAAILICSEKPLQLGLYDSTLALLADYTLGNGCESIGQRLNAGSYYVRIEEQEPLDYTITLEAGPDVCIDQITVENDSDMTLVSTCRVVVGALTILNVGTLAPLDNLEQIWGDVSAPLTMYVLRIENTALTDLGYLNQLETVAGNVAVLNNPSMTTLSGLDNLQSVNGYVGISGNSQLVSITGMNSLRQIDNSLNISQNENLVTISGFTSLESVGNLHINTNDLLVDISGLGSLSRVGYLYGSGALRISRNSSLSSLAALSALQTVNGYIQITENSALTNLVGLDGLSAVPRSVTIRDNDALTSLDGMSALTTIGEMLMISQNDALIDLSGCNGLTHVGTDLVVTENVTLPTCEAERLRDEIGVENIGGKITIYGNDDNGTCP
jgi:hypothetical protein